MLSFMERSPPSRLAWLVHNLDDDGADIDIFDVIGDPWGEGTSAKDFVQELRAIVAAHIRLHINSPGGYVDDALAMFTAIQQHPAEIKAYIESIAASAASFVAMAADKILIAKNAKIMIHDAYGLGIGNAKDLRALADYLDAESDNIASIYADKAGGNASEWRDAMQASEGLGTTYRGQAAVDAGLADELMTVPVRRNLVPLKAVAQAKNAGRTMSQANLNNLHGAMESLDSVHEGTCDMGEDCPIGGVSDRVPRSNNEEWSAAYINRLADNAFAIILAGGEKDDDGKTTPRSLRKLPHHDASGDLDIPHWRNAKSREPQTDMTEVEHEKARDHLDGHAEEAGGDTEDEAQSIIAAIERGLREATEEVLS